LILEINVTVEWPGHGVRLVAIVKKYENREWVPVVEHKYG
jgi:hypothetical protein